MCTLLVGFHRKNKILTVFLDHHAYREIIHNRVYFYLEIWSGRIPETVLKEA